MQRSRRLVLIILFIMNLILFDNILGLAYLIISWILNHAFLYFHIRFWVPFIFAPSTPSGGISTFYLTWWKVHLLHQRCCLKPKEECEEIMCTSTFYYLISYSSLFSRSSSFPRLPSYYTFLSSFWTLKSPKG